MDDWLPRTPIWLLGVALFAITVAATVAGGWLGKRADRMPVQWGHLSEAQTGYVVAAVYTLLGLLVGFTFSIAVERYQLRRELVVQDANAIEQLYLQAQLLGEPDRSRFSALLVQYAENHIALGHAHHENAETANLIASDGALQRDLWRATVSAFRTIRTIDFSSTFVDSVNGVIRIDAERKAVRQGQIPYPIILLLMIYSITAAGLLGAVMNSRKGEIISVVLLFFSTLALMVIADLNRPVEGLIRESQQPMEQMLARLKANPPAKYQVTP